jgi:hypothetical protein
MSRRRLLMKVNFKPVTPSSPPDPYSSTLVVETIIGWDFKYPTIPKLYKAATTKYDESNGIIANYESNWPLDLDEPIVLKEITPSGDIVQKMEISKEQDWFVVKEVYGGKTSPSNRQNFKLLSNKAGALILRNVAFKTLPVTGNSITISYHCKL